MWPELYCAIENRESLEGINRQLDHRADINAVGGEYGTALAAAALSGRMDIALLLLDQGADINIVGGEFGTALTAAAIGGHIDTVLLLLDRGADINKVGGRYGTALAAAAYGVKVDIVPLLLDRGADINAPGGEFGAAWAAAASSWSTDIVLLLLDRGADIDMVGGGYGTALAVAAFRGRMQMVVLLLRRGANINLKEGGKYGTALTAAALGGSADIVSLLLDRGAEINAVSGEFGTALTAAVFYGKTRIVSLLLDQGADVNMVGGKYGTALAAATLSGSTEIASLLLKHGGDIMRVGGCYPTASGVYPNVLDAAHSGGSRASPVLPEPLKIAITPNPNVDIVILPEPLKIAITPNPNVDIVVLPEPLKIAITPNPNVDIVANVISRPPFPMPYSGPYSALAHYTTLQSSSSPFDILSTKLPADGNIAPEIADVPCRELSEEVLGRLLAALVGLREDTIQARHQWIQNDVRYFVARDFDFGLAYAAVRIAWKEFNHSVDCSLISTLRARWHKHAQSLDEARLKAIQIDDSSAGHGFIVSPYSIMPRRLWDLKSNRLIDFTMLHAAQVTTETIPTFWAVSHSWTSDMSPVWSAINQHQWPIPLPKNISLDYLRSELFNIGAEYVWIDVVCLRQKSGANHPGLEQLKREEWKLDVPTIGNIYRAAKKIVRYFNGLGVGFRNDGWDDPRHWLQRAWTVQEIASENNTINGGTPWNQGQVLLNSRGKVFGKDIKLREAIRPVIQLAAQVDDARGCEVYKLAQEMTRRHASHPVDKISGLFYLLRTTKLPCYDEQITSEGFWRQCFHLLPADRKMEILFDFPYRGSDQQWFPTWAQVLDWPERDPAYDHMRSQELPDLVQNVPGESSFFISNIWVIPHAILYETDVQGEYEAKISDKFFGFYLPYLSQTPIDVQDEPIFTLAVMDLGHTYNWVVCEPLQKQVRKDNDGVTEVNVLKKVGVIRTDSCGELVVGGEHGKSLLQKMACLFV